MNYCDLHCDTPFEMFRRSCGLNGEGLNITAEKFSVFDRYVQLAAYCVPPDETNDEGFSEFFEVAEHFTAETAKHSFVNCSDTRELEAAVRSGRPAFILTVEDARILNGDIDRLDRLYGAGVRFLTPLWGGETCIGGSHESERGLTPFGRSVAEKCASLGIITDISHASIRSAEEMLEIAGEYSVPVIASHSCSHAVNPHSRNLTDALLCKVADSGGIVGVNMYPPHLKGDNATVDDIIRHISHYIDKVGECHVAIGADFDGMGIFTRGAEDIGCIPNIRDRMLSSGFTHDTCERIFFANAYDFLKRNLK